MISISSLFVLATAFGGLAVANPVSKRQFAGVHTGDATVYDVGLGACGIFNVPTDFIVAVSHSFFDTYPGATANPNNNPVCNQAVTASYQGRSIQVTITDRCEACAFDDLDFSDSAFEALIGPISIGRAHGMQWFINSLGGSPPPTNGTCAQTYTVVSGDTCDAIDRQFGITLQTFLSLNPSVNPQCTKLQVGTAYCVRAGGSPPGGGNCPQRYTAVAGDTCDAIDQKFGITLDQFLAMNPSVNAQCTNLQVGTSYCV